MTNSFFPLSFLLDKFKKKNVVQKSRLYQTGTINDIDDRISVFENSLNGRYIRCDIHRPSSSRVTSISNSPISSMESVRYSPLSSTISSDMLSSSKDLCNEYDTRLMKSYQINRADTETKINHEFLLHGNIDEYKTFQQADEIVIN